MTLDELVKDFKKTAVNLAKTSTLQYLIANVWVGFGWIGLNPLVGFLVGYVLDIALDKLDGAVYMVIDDWQTTAEGKAFALTAAVLNQALDKGNADEIAAAQKAKRDAFDKLVSLGSPP